MIAGRNVFLGSTIHLPCVRCFPESHNSRLFHEMFFSLSDTFSKKAVIPMRSPRSEFSVKLAASRPEDTFIDLLLTQPVG